MSCFLCEANIFFQHEKHDVPSMTLQYFLEKPVALLQVACFFLQLIVDSLGIPKWNPVGRKYRQRFLQDGGLWGGNGWKWWDSDGIEDIWWYILYLDPARVQFQALGLFWGVKGIKFQTLGGFRYHHMKKCSLYVLCAWCMTKNSPEEWKPYCLWR